MQAQKNLLHQIKKNLESRHGKLTWDEFARLAGVEPRALKTYRMPEGSADYRQMPPLVKQAFEDLLAQPTSATKNTSVILPGLAWLVLQQARIAVIDKQIVSGLDRYRGSRNGLTQEERKIMALLSRYCLTNGLADLGGEIHALLQLCTRPLREWLLIPEILAAGYGETVLINPDSLIPTPEAEELAAGFSTVAARIEEDLFAKFKELLGKYSSDAAALYYRSVREFVVRNPVVRTDNLFVAGKTLPSVLWMAVQQEFYEALPESVTEEGRIQLCKHCSSLMLRVGNALRCQARACALTRKACPGDGVLAEDYRRVTRGIRQYWVDPGIDEIRMFDELRAAGLEAELYPHCDRVDLAIGDVLGIDLKTYNSPEVLGARLSRGLGGLSFYEDKWLVIPDWLVNYTPGYLDRLKSALGDKARRIRCLSLTDALRETVRMHAPKGNA